MYYLQRYSVNHVKSIGRRLYYLALVLLVTSISFSQTNNDAAFPLILPGLEYVHQRIGTGPLSIHRIKIDRSQSQFAFTSSLAKKSIYGLEPLSRQIQALDPLIGRPLAAVNGDFFRIRTGLYQGDPLGLQIVRGELVSSPKNTCFWIDPKGKPRIAYVQPSFRATWRNGTSVNFDINQECVQDGAVLYTPSMGFSTRTKNAIELVLEKCDDSGWLPIKPGQTCNGRILSINHEANSVIPNDKLVLSIGPALANKIKSTEPGMVLSLSFKTSPALTGVDFAIGGGPVLIKDAKVRQFTGYQPRHPRTAIGWNDKHFFLLVVDGRQKDLSIGMTFPELAEFMLKLGCTEAMNLDGGGSSTFWLDGQIMNSPSDGRQRWIANGLILLQKKQNDKQKD
ncbi:MAG: phosphodiester glycosidase family protein [Planctomycetes bacterium]|nr:phosphodiester glycosidase family protein [Planctomycetota bacterium]